MGAHPKPRPSTPEEIDAAIAKSKADREKRIGHNRKAKQKVFDPKKATDNTNWIRERTAEHKQPLTLSWIHISEFDLRKTTRTRNQIMVMLKDGSMEALPKYINGNKIKEYLGFRYAHIKYWCLLPIVNVNETLPTESSLYLETATKHYEMNTLTRVCVPSRERLKQLYAYGYSNTEMAEIMNQEFSDIEFDTYNAKRIKEVIQFNLEEFVEFRSQMQGKCVEQIQKQVKLMFEATKDVELVMVRVYVKKLQDAMESLDNLDLDEIDDETGAYKNTSRIFVLIEMAEKLQSKIAKIVGTDALREIEIYKAKVALKAESDNRVGHLMPAFGREVEANQATRFI